MGHKVPEGEFRCRDWFDAVGPAESVESLDSRLVGAPSAVSYSLLLKCREVLVEV